MEKIPRHVDIDFPDIPEDQDYGLPKHVQFCSA